MHVSRVILNKFNKYQNFMYWPILYHPNISINLRYFFHSLNEIYFTNVYKKYSYTPCL